MSVAELTQPEAVRSAMDEFDELGRDPFLEKYEYGRAKRYFVRRGGKLYDSKAIAGVAFGFQYPERGPMRNSEFSGGETSVVKRLEELGFDLVDARDAEDSLILPQAEVDAFIQTLGSPEYANSERDYKIAVHEVISRLLAPGTLARPDFPELLADFFDRKLNLGDLGFDEEQAHSINNAAGGAPPSGVTNAFVNLCGGRFGANNFIWIPSAAKAGLGEELRQAFKTLVDPDADLAERVETFRASLYSIQEESKARGGFRPEWSVIRISLAFTAALLGAYDPTRYTFYHQGKLKKSYEEFVGPWPKEQGGELYTTLCGFIQRVSVALESQGAPIRDLIDAQSFVYLRAWTAEQAAASVETQTDLVEPQAASTLHLVAKWSPRFGADTVELHRAVADEHGEVWWGVIGSAARKKLSDENLARLRDQITHRVETNVFLAGPAPAPVARTRLTDIRSERPADVDLIPSYYPSSLHHSLWLKLSDFTEMSQLELLQSLEPSAAPGRTVTLTNQANPLLVRVRSAPRVWWVNQGASYKRALAGGYLWAPILDKVGQKKNHWESLQYARIGDVVLNHAEGRVRAVSRVSRTAYSATRPDPDADQDWSNDGRRVDAEYRELETPLPVSAIPEGRRQSEGGAFDRDGGVNQGYFFALSDAMVSVIRGLSPELAALLPTPDEIVTVDVSEERYEEPDLETITEAVLAQGLALSRRTIRRYHLSLKSRGFVVLSGVSGTGKTWLAQAYARAVGAEFRVVPVAPNWTTNEDLLGYRNPIDDIYRDTQFSLFLRAASAEWLQASRENRPARPYHVILDEMNLARVEYYFAEFLSAMELRQREGQVVVELAPGDEVTLGPNLLFVGTVNIDETTHLFADKVFDRAQLVELSIDREALKEHIGQQPYADTLLAFWDALHEVAPFAFRIVDEIGIYVSHAGDLGASWQEALDEQVFQKLLPKVKGADPRVGTALERFIEIAGDDLPMSRSKAEAMHESFVQHGFSSYF